MKTLDDFAFLVLERMDVSAINSMWIQNQCSDEPSHLTMAQYIANLCYDQAEAMLLEARKRHAVKLQSAMYSVGPIVCTADEAILGQEVSNGR